MSTEIAVLPASSVLPTPGEWGFMLDMAGALVASGMLPAHIRTREAAVAIMLKGKELGIPPMYAFSNIVVINGKPTAQAELMLALIYRDHGDDAIRVVESTPARCVVSYKRRAWTERQSNAFTIEDAKQANLIKAGPWMQYPAAMLRARCISAVARMAFPDSIGGMYTPEELGGKVQVTEHGEALYVETASGRTNTETGEVPNIRTIHTAPDAPMTKEQLSQIGNYTRLLRERFSADLPSAAAYNGYTVAQAEGAIAMLVDMLAQHQADFEAQFDAAEKARKAAKPADPVVPQHSDDQLDVAFPEVPMHVGTP